MASAKEHAKTLLSGIIPGKFDRLVRLRTELTSEHFADDLVQQKMFQFLEHFATVTGGVMKRGALEDLLRDADAGRRALYLETYDDLASLSVDDIDFEWSLAQIKDLTAEKHMKEALVEGLEIITKGLENTKGELIKGQSEARLHVLDRFADIDRTLAKQESPIGEIRDEAEIMLAEYHERKAARLAGTDEGVNFGIADLDAKVGGLQRGELWLSAGYSSDGKTSLCVQLAWSAAMEQGKNVLFITTETVNTTIRRKLVARHSKHPKFESFGLPEGLNTRDMKNGTLNDLEEALYDELIRDLSDKKNDYGRFTIAQLPRGATVEVAEAIMNQTQHEYNLDLAIWDYLALFRSSSARSTDRESLSGVIKESKQISTTFNKGKGVPLISPWQVNRSSREDAQKIQMYTTMAMAETAEATNSSDGIVSMLAPEDNTNRYAELVMQLLKHRDGETANGIITNVDYATSHFASRMAFGSFGSTARSSGGGGGFDGLEDLIS